MGGFYQHYEGGSYIFLMGAGRAVRMKDTNLPSTCSSLPLTPALALSLYDIYTVLRALGSPKDNNGAEANTRCLM